MDDWTDEAAEQLERLIRDPMADAASGIVEVVAVSEPAARGRYQEATIELLVPVPGSEPQRVRVTGVFPVRRWPHVGMRAPARISRSDPSMLDIAWDAAR